jgi:RNA polymerase sigma factor (sigma-70 family)
VKQWHTDLETARDGDLDAFGAVVREFQDMAVGYAFSVLGDFDQAQDAAQEAFIQTYQTLADLRDVAAFPGWLRKIVFTQCSRQTRGKRVRTVPLDVAPDVASKEPNPMQAAERNELRQRVLEAINALPEHERAAVSLFYINGYSQAEVGEFLDVPAKTVKSRLHSARGKMRERMMDMVEETLKDNAPDDNFTQRVIEEVSDKESPHLPEMERMFCDLFADDCAGELIEEPSGEVTWDTSVPGRPFFTEILTKRTQNSERPEAQVFIAKCSGKAVGFLQIFYRLRTDGLIGWVDLLGVSAPFQNRGIESDLFRQALSATREAASARHASPLGVLYLAGREDALNVRAFEQMGSQVRRDLVYRIGPDEEGHGPILWFPMSDDVSGITTKALAWELWQFGSLPRAMFVEQYGELDAT